MEDSKRDALIPEFMCPDAGVITMAFVNIQSPGEVYDVSAGFRRGTIYPELDKPLSVKSRMENEKYER